MTMTTIKVPVELRERISANAKSHGVTAATLIAAALDDFERRARWEKVQKAYAALEDEDGYWEEFHEWDAVLADGLTDE